MDIAEWPAGVNRIVLGESQLSIGENAVISDKSENGAEMSRLAASDSPDTYSVVMWFSNSVHDSFWRNHTDSQGNHVTEWGAFLQWVKHTVMLGTVPFHFAALSDPSGRKKAVYKMSSSGIPKGQPVGDKIKCTMTWKEVFTDAISIEESPPEADTVTATNGQADFRFLEPPGEDTDIEAEGFSMEFQYGETFGEMSDRGPLAVRGMDYDGFRSAVLYFDSFKTPGAYRIFVRYGDGTHEASCTLYVEEDEDA